MKFKKNLEIEKGRLDLTPLVDVVLLLIIFFMLTSSFVTQPTIPIKLPKAVTGESLKKERTEIFVTEDNIVYMRGNPITVPDLKKKLKNRKNKAGILIKSDKSASLGKIVEVWDVCREIGISQIDLATTSPKKK